MGPLSEPEFCASCHELEPVHMRWQKSGHHVNSAGVSVKCIACHLPPRDHYISHLVAKTLTGTKDTFIHFFGGEFDEETLRKRVTDTLPSERCLYCHDNLLSKPRSRSIKIVHTTAVEQCGASDRNHACTTCHNDLHSPAVALPPIERKEREEPDNYLCLVCHINFRDQDPFVTAHEAASIACYDCHGWSEPHMDDEEHLTPPERMYEKSQVNASCMTSECHTQDRMEKTKGHTPFFAKHTTHEYCTDCHGMHRIEKRVRRWDKKTGKLIEYGGDPVTGEIQRKSESGMDMGMGM